MWIFTNSAFVSIVEDRDDPALVWVRGRVAGDVERFLGFTGAQQWDVERTPSADYLFRVCVPRELAAKALLDQVRKIDYDNFKSSIAKTKAGNTRHEFYMRIWTAMMAYQRRLAPKSGYWFGKGKGNTWR